MSLKKFFLSIDGADESNDKTNQLALAVLLFRLVRCDSETKMLELMHMSELLRKEFSLTQEELELVFENADQEESKGVSSAELIVEVCENLSSQNRIKIVEFLWVLAFADDKIAGEEVDLIRDVAKQLKLTGREQATAQESAEKHLGLDLF